MMAQSGKIAFHTMVLFLGRAMGLLVAVVRLNFIASALGVTSFGILSFAAYFVALFATLADFGLQPILTREISRAPERAGSFVWNGLLLKGALTGATLMVMGGVLFFSRFDPETVHAVTLSMAIFGFTSISTVFLGALQGQQKMVLTSLLTLTQDLLNSIGVIALIRMLPSITTVLLIGIAAAAINLSLACLLVMRLGGVNYRAADRGVLRYLLREGFPLAVTSLGISTYTYAGATVLKVSRGDAEAGLYGAAHKLLTIATLVPASFTQSIYPILSGFYRMAPQRVAEALADCLRAMALVSVPLAAGAVVLSPGIAALIYPPEFGGSAAALAILLGSCSVGHLNWVMTTFLAAVNRQRFIMVATLVVGALVVALNLIVVPAAGYLATAWILASAEGALFLMYAGYLRRGGFPVRLAAALMKPVAAALLMALALYYLPGIHVLLRVSIGLLLYSALIVALRGLGRQECEMLRRLIGK